MTAKPVREDASTTTERQQAMGDGTKLTRAAYEKLIAEDVSWVMQQPRTSERDHVVLVLRASVDLLYPCVTPNGRVDGHGTYACVVDGTMCCSFCKEPLW